MTDEFTAAVSACARVLERYYYAAWAEPDADADGNGVGGVSPEPKRCLTSPKEPV